MSMFDGLNSNVHRCDTWAQVEKNAAYGRSFYSVPLKVTGENLWVLSDPSKTMYGWRDEFANMILDSVRAREARYMHDMGGDGTKESWDDITFVIIRRGNAIMAIRRNGEILVNERARTGEKYYADAVRRLEPIYRDLFKRMPNHYLIKLEGE